MLFPLMVTPISRKRRRRPQRIHSMQCSGAAALIYLPLVVGWITTTTRPPLSTTTTTPSYSQRQRKYLLPLRAKFRVADLNWEHCVAIVPSSNNSTDMFWDAIQRARFWAGDHTYTSIPPCVRLLHPLVLPRLPTSSTPLPLALARIVEQEPDVLAPFNVTLVRWSVLPHTEILEQAYSASMLQRPKDVDVATERLIASLAAQGRRNKAARTAVKTRKLREQGIEIPDEPGHNNAAVDDDHRAVHSDPTVRDVEAFDGPCVICLEPDRRSSARLQHLHALLRRKLGQPKIYSPTALVSQQYGRPANAQQVKPAVHYRPVVPIASFASVSAALPVARHLQTSWTLPLTLHVSNLHFMSVDEHAGDRWGCDAVVNLEKSSSDDHDDVEIQRQVDLLCERGIPGGYGKDVIDGIDLDLKSSSLSSADDAIHDANNQVQARAAAFEEFWFGEDNNRDGDDNAPDDDTGGGGAIFQMGRVTFYLGAQREYPGMPAVARVGEKVSITSSSSGTRRRKTARNAARNMEHRKLLAEHSIASGQDDDPVVSSPDPTDPRRTAAVFNGTAQSTDG